MEEKVKKQKFLQLQFCTLLLVLTLLPEMNVASVFGVPDIDIPVFCCKVVGIIGAGLALYGFYKSAQDVSAALPMPFLASSAGGLLLALVTLFPGVPTWLEYVALVALLVALYMGKDSLGVNWMCWGSQGAYLILMAVLLHVYDGIGGTMLTGLAALVGLVFYFMGLGKLKSILDDDGVRGVSKLKTAVILSIVAVVIGLLPLLGGIIGGIIAIIAFIFEFIGYGALKKSATIGAEGQAGAGKLRVSMIVVLVGCILGFLPGIGDTIEAFLSIVALFLLFKGWTMVLFGLEGEVEKSASAAAQP